VTLSRTSFCVVSPRKKEKKRNINNDLAVLPSHDTFRSSQINNSNVAIIADGGIKKSQVTTAIAHIWSDNHIIKSLKVHSIK